MIGDHFYTISVAERDNASRDFGYVSEGIACYVLAGHDAGTVPFYRLSAGNGDHFYTTDAVERDNAESQYGYQKEGDACYVYPAQTAGSVPLHRLLNPDNGDHFYTASDSEARDAQNIYHYTYEGIACYVFATEVAGTVALHRLLKQSNKNPISDKYAVLGGGSGFLGGARSAETQNSDAKGWHQLFAAGVIYWHPDLGAYEVHGAILNRWRTLGAEASPLGYPMTDETSTPDGVGRYNHFRHGSIYWHPRTGAHDVRGRIRERWAQLRWERGFLGYPIADHQVEMRGRETFSISRFQGGRIELNEGTGHVQTVHAPRPNAPLYEVPVIALQARDDNGTNPSNITAVDVNRWIARANEVFSTAGIRFVFDGVLVAFDSTAANNLTGTDDENWPSVRDALNEQASQRQAMIVLFRRGFRGGFSWWDYDFVVMCEFGGTPPPLGLLAHESGHFFGLPHTHGPSFPNEQDAADFLLSRRGDANIFDNDRGLLDGSGRPIIGDTWPDPFIEALALDAARTSVRLAGIPFALARENAMSYWYRDIAQTFSHDQIDRIRNILVERMNRTPLNVTVITSPLRVGVTPYPVLLNRVVHVTVSATDVESGNALSGNVIIDGHVVARTNTVFTYRFRPKKRRIPGSKPPQWEVTYPSGVVSVPGYSDTPIDFGFE